jgi:integrase
LKPVLDAAQKKAEALGSADASRLREITFQVCRRTCGTLRQPHGNVKDIQAHLRHAQASTTLEVYVHAIPESVEHAVHLLYRNLFGAGQGTGRLQ